MSQSIITKGPKKKVMIIDDNVSNLQIARSILSDKYETIAATSGQAALKIMQKIKPDLILMDIEMPSLNGFQTFFGIQMLAIKCPVIFLSAYSGIEIEKIVMDSGGAGYLAKPFEANDLLNMVGKYI